MTGVEKNDQPFRKLVMDFWRKEGRHDLPWRATDDPYAILVSEVMLQQTQVGRVLERWPVFLQQFPSVRHLARAPITDVLRVWQGMGYNRRALNLQRAVQAIVERHGGVVPSSYTDLVDLPGVGPYTAAAVMAFAFNRPRPMIETNIRRVYLHHFFPNKTVVPDTTIMPIVERTLNVRTPRRWYWALMDYGAHLATQLPNPNRRSKHYVRQTKFEGSHRQLRAQVIKTLIDQGPSSMRTLQARHNDPRLSDALQQLIKEGFLKRQGRLVVVA
jgi:A/G-specific adenine glycosylase